MYGAETWTLRKRSTAEQCRIEDAEMVIRDSTDRKRNYEARTEARMR